MLHAVLDTSIYSGNPRRSNLAFRALIRLAKAGRVQLHISEITKREFTGQQRDRIESPLKEAIASLKKLRKSNNGDVCYFRNGDDGRYRRAGGKGKVWSQRRV